MLYLKAICPSSNRSVIGVYPSAQLPETSNKTTHRHKKEYTSIKTTSTKKERLLHNVYTLEKKTRVITFQTNA